MAPALRVLALFVASSSMGRFTYSFGDGGDPATTGGARRPGPGLARSATSSAPGPSPPPRLPHDQPGRYVWPSAFGYDSWKAVPHDAKDVLEPLYERRRSVRRFALTDKSRDAAMSSGGADRGRRKTLTLMKA